MKVVDILDSQYKPDDILNELSSGAKLIEELVVLNIKKDGTMEISHTEMEPVSLIGWLEIAKDTIIKEYEGA